MIMSVDVEKRVRFGVVRVESGVIVMRIGEWLCNRT